MFIHSGGGHHGDGARAPRRRHADELKARVLAACAELGASVSAVEHRTLHTGLKVPPLAQYLTGLAVARKCIQ